MARACQKPFASGHEIVLHISNAPFWQHALYNFVSLYD